MKTFLISTFTLCFAFSCFANDSKIHSITNIANWSKGVYWCSRDLDGSPLGNHHFLLFIGDKNMSIFPGKSPVEEEGYYFMTASAGGEQFNPTDWGKLQMHINHKSDIQAVLEGINPDEYTSWYKADYDIEAHKINELSVSSFSTISGYLKNYSDNQNDKNIEGYDLDDNNCATWVNTLLKTMGVSESRREQYGEFDGIDWGEEESFSSDYFLYRLSKKNTAKNTLAAGESLKAGERLISANGSYIMRMQEDDGNLCIYNYAKGRQGRFVWGSMKYGFKNAKLVMQTDGNLVVYNGGNAAKWSSQTHPYYNSQFKTASNKPVKAVLENDGKLKLYTAAGAVVWSSN